MIESNDPASPELLVDVSVQWSLELRDVAKLGPIPATMTLLPPYPNPFNASARLSFSLPKAGEGMLGLYSLEGREVATIADGYFHAGWQNVTLEAGDLPAGVYLARLAAGSEVATTRVVVMK